jgi:hypothetical protein
VRSNASFSLAVLLAACDAGTIARDAGPDSDLPDPSLVDIPWLAEGGPPITSSPAHECPEAFRREALDHGLIACRPWPEGGPASCEGVQAHFPGEPGCARIGTECPAGDWPAGLPSDRPIVYVRAGAVDGNGTMARPYAGIGYAVSIAPENAVIAVARGTYVGRVDLFNDITVWGACPEETILTQETPSEMDTVVGAFLGDGELRNLTVRAPVTMGIYVDAGTTVNVIDVLVDRASGYGIYVAGEDASIAVENTIVRGATDFPSGVGGAAMQVIDGASATVRRTSFERSSLTQIVVGFGSTATFERIAIRDATGESDQPRPGTAMAVQEDGEATVRASGIWNHVNGGLLSAFESRITLEDVAIEEMTAGLGGTASAVEARSASTIEGSFVFVQGARTSALLAGEDGALVFRDVAVLDTRPAGDFDLVGAGLSLEGASSATLERALIAGSRRSGIVARPGTTLNATDLVVRDTESSGPREIGTGLTLFGTATLERAIVDRSTLEGVAISDVGARVTFTDVAIRNTRGTPSSGFYGRGLEVNLGAVLTGERVALESNREVSLFVVDEGSIADLDELYVRDSLGMDCAEACPQGQQYGYGMTALFGGRIELDGFVVTRGRLLGVQVGEAGVITGTRGEISENTIGANIQEPSFDLESSLIDVAFRANERNIDAMFLPVPDPALGGP